MSSICYDGMVGMKPEIEMRSFLSDDEEFSYQLPKVCFECCGDVNSSEIGFDWRRDSVMVVKDNRAVRYSELNYYELLMTEVDGQADWIDGGIVKILGYDYSDVSDIRPIKEYRIEEFDLNNSVKRTYKVVLEDTSQLKAYDESYIKSIVGTDSNPMGEEYVLRDLDN